MGCSLIIWELGFLCSDAKPFSLLSVSLSLSQSLSAGLLFNSEEEEEKEEEKAKKKMESGVEWIKELSDVPTGKLPPHLELQRTRVECKADAPIHTDTFQYSGAYASIGVDNSVRLDNFRDNFRVEVIRLTDEEMEFDMIGIDPALANAFRRILIAEVPTMAIEKVLIANNTSVVQDEVLSHRLGLIPIKADPRLFEFTENGAPTEKNTIVFKLHVRCEQGEPRLTGMEIELEAHAVKGVGKTHAKWSPVGTAWYRMLPEVVLLEEIEDKAAEQLKAKCPVGVFDIEDIGNGKKRAAVVRPRACTLCRECIRGGKEWEDRVALRRVKDHFIFTLESTGALPPEVLFTEAVKILEDKCERVISELS
ncbi:hypothetical protein FEM48_Zijuj01G0255700 [Ziziphus jujuba var. spinosa]|uniref:DNA-directed RNA polymerase RpoA/D/Rpb3-type domain-containing protein n=1 Tax=Ziziphus jujuba var. spinosa TaxID=714518 RepID=A0A978W4R9_ZIZJJ|nr:hypothetical protein FEM48_Zijuj01G0255700 [Ziziphus jujuba var. spinosa]